MVGRFFIAVCACGCVDKFLFLADGTFGTSRGAPYCPTGFDSLDLCPGNTSMGVAVRFQVSGSMLMSANSLFPRLCHVINSSFSASWKCLLPHCLFRIGYPSAHFQASSSMLHVPCSMSLVKPGPAVNMNYCLYLCKIAMFQNDKTV